MKFKNKNIWKKNLVLFKYMWSTHRIYLSKVCQKNCQKDNVKTKKYKHTLPEKNIILDHNTIQFNTIGTK